MMDLKLYRFFFLYCCRRRPVGNRSDFRFFKRLVELRLSFLGVFADRRQNVHVFCFGFVRFSAMVGLYIVRGFYRCLVNIIQVFRRWHHPRYDRVMLYIRILLLNEFHLVLLSVIFHVLLGRLHH